MPLNFIYYFKLQFLYYVTILYILWAWVSYLIKYIVLDYNAII